jgi:hypothetical protein
MRQRVSVDSPRSVSVDMDERFTLQRIGEATRGATCWDICSYSRLVAAREHSQSHSNGNSTMHAKKMVFPT